MGFLAELSSRKSFYLDKIKQPPSNFSLTSSYMLKGNVINSNGNPGVSNTLNLDFEARSLSAYYKRLNELSSYEMTKISKTVLDLFSSYIKSSIHMQGSYLTIEGDEAMTEKLNNILNSINYRQEVLKNIEHIIYYGSYGFLINFNDEDEPEKLAFKYPYSLVKVYKKGEFSGTLMKSDKGVIKKFEKESSVLFYFGSENLSLTNDLRYESTEEQSQFLDTDDFYNSFEYLVGTPLFYEVVLDLKNYILKELLIEFLSIKDLLLPLILLTGVETPSDEGAAMEFAQRLESLINKYSDFTTIMNGNYSAGQLLELIIKNVKVIPDFDKTLSELNELDLSKITKQLSTLRSERDANRNEILTSIACPVDLYTGQANKQEAIKTSERLQIKVSDYLSILYQGTVNNISSLYKYFTEKDLDISKLRVTLFKPTAIEYLQKLNGLQTIQDLISSLDTLTDAVQKLIVDSNVLNPSGTLNLISKWISNVDPEFSTLLDTTKILETIEKKSQQPKEEL